MRWPNPSRRLNARPLLRDSRSAGFSKDHAHLGGRSAKQKLFSSRSTSFSPGEDSGGQERSPRDQSPLTPRRRTDSPARAAERRPRRKPHRFQPLTDDPPPGGPGHLPDIGPAPRGAACPPCRVPAPARCPPPPFHSFPYGLSRSATGTRRPRGGGSPTAGARKWGFPPKDSGSENSFPRDTLLCISKGRIHEPYKVLGSTRQQK